jgi:hypothetical protein
MLLRIGSTILARAPSGGGKLGPRSLIHAIRIATENEWS